MGLGWVEEDTSSHVLPYTCLALCIKPPPSDPFCFQLSHPQDRPPFS